MVKDLFVPSSLMLKSVADQFVVAGSGFCCNVQSLQADGQDTTTLFSEDLTLSVGKLTNTDSVLAL